jgi:hypothetical protein
MSGDFETIDAGGEPRILNLMPSPADRLVMVPAPRVTIPDSAIVPFDAWPSPLKIKDQDGRGACNGHASATVNEFARYQSGQPYVPLSAWWVYGQLVRGRDTGSNILDALALMTKSGCGTEAEVKYGDFSGRYADGVNKDALSYRLEISAKLTTWEEVLTAVALRQPVNLSIHVGMRFNNLDSDGCPAVGRGPGNHAVMVGGGIKKGKRGNWLIRMANSWGTSWGDQGFCWLSQDHIESGSWFEAFAVKAVIEDVSDSDNPPPAPVA